MCCDIDRKKLSVYKTIVKGRLTILSSIPKATDKNPVRQKLWERMIKDDARHWMTSFLEEVYSRNVYTEAATVFDGPEDAMKRVPKEATIDLLVCFVNEVNPRLASDIVPVLFDQRVKIMLILAERRMEWDASWLQNMNTLSTTAYKIPSGIYVPRTSEIPEERLQIREMDHYKTMDMKNLINRLLSIEDC